MPSALRQTQSPKFWLNWLEGESRGCLQQLWPRSADHTLLEGLPALSGKSGTDPSPALPGKSFSSRLRETVRRLGRQEELGQIPLIAVAGTINSGKSTTVASFLSFAQRDRVARGLLQERTQRFVFWLPGKWEQSGALESFREEAWHHFGFPLEALPKDPGAAKTMTGGTPESGRGFLPPLFATDPGLDQLGFGLIDCPDVQRAWASGAEEPQDSRLEEVTRVFALCSAVFFVVDVRQGQASVVQEFVSRLRRQMADLPVFLVFNLLPPEYAAEQILQDEILGDMARLFHGVFFSYDTRMAGWREKLGELNLTDCQNRAMEDIPAGYPFFFRTAAPSLPSKEPAGWANATTPAEVAAKLDPSQLHRQKMQNLDLELRTTLTEATLWLESAVKTRNQKTVEAWFQLMIPALRPLVDEEGHFRVQMDAALLRRLDASFLRTAPLDLRIYLRVGGFFRSTIQEPLQAVRDFVRHLHFKISPAKLREAGEFFRSHRAFGMIEPHTLAQSLLGGLPCPDLALSELQHRVEKALAAVPSRWSPDLPDDELDAFCREFWERKKERRLQAHLVGGATLAAGIALALLVPFDFGGGSVLLAASLPELLAAGGAGGMAAVLSTMQTSRRMVEHLAFPLARAWTYLLTKEFGLPDQIDCTAPELGAMVVRELERVESDPKFSPPVRKALRVLLSEVVRSSAPGEVKNPSGVESLPAAAESHFELWRVHSEKLHPTSAPSSRPPSARKKTEPR